MASINPQILITAKDEASKVLKGVADEADSTGRSLGQTLKDNVVELGAAFTAVTGVIATSIMAYSESENTLAQLDAVLKSTGGSAGMARDKLIDLSASLQQSSKFSDEAILGGENLLLTFTKIGKETFPQATQTMLDMSQALGQDLKSSAIQLGKAMNDPIQGVTALRRVGVAFSEDQLKMIETLQKSGDLLGAQNIILKELSTEFGGSASAAAQTFSGQLIILQNNFNDLQETIGKGLLDSIGKLTGGDGFEKLNQLIISVNQFLTQHQDILIALSIALLTVAGILGGLFLAALVAVAGASAGIIATVGAIIGIIAFLGAMIVQHWTEIRTVTQEVWATVILVFQNVMMAIQGFIDWFVSIPSMIEAMLLSIGQFFINLFMVQIPLTIAFLIGYLSTAIPNLIANMIVWFSQLPPMVLSIFTQVYNNILNKIQQTWAWLSGEVSQWSGRIQGFLANLPSIVGEIFENAKQAVLNKMSEMWDGVFGWWGKIKGVLQGIIDMANAALNAVRNAFNAGQQSGKGAGRATGGIVPGAIGSPQMVLAHGGEEIVPFRSGKSDRGGSSVNFTVQIGLYAGSENEKRLIAEELYSALITAAASQNKTVTELFGGI